MMELRALGQYLAQRRKELGIPVAAVARRAGIARSTVYAVESGKDPRTGKPPRPRPELLERWAQALELPLGHILELAGYVGRGRPVAASPVAAAGPPSPAAPGDQDTSFARHVAEIVSAYDLPYGARQDVWRRILRVAQSLCEDEQERLKGGH